VVKRKRFATRVPASLLAPARIKGTSHNIYGGDVMSDDLGNRAPADRSGINVNEAWALRYWSKELGVTPDRIMELVRQHGVSVAAVRQALGK
jgi:Protein of unknown function (DUF3606)